MAALTGYRSTQRMTERPLQERRQDPIDANVWIHQGALVVINGGATATGTAGTVRPGRVALGDICIGVCDGAEGPGTVNLGGAANTLGFNNTGGAASAFTVPVRAGVYKFNNSAAGDAIAAADQGRPCYIVDDQTVAKGDGFGTRSIAGIIEQVDSDGVWVQVGMFDREASFSGAGPAGGSVLSIPVTYVSIAAGQLMGAINLPPVAGRVLSMQLVTAVAGTGAGATATLTPRITQPGGAASAITGLTLVPTLANTTPVGNVVAQAGAPSVVGTGAGGCGFLPGSKLDIQASAVTAFTAGSGVILITLA